ncbi:hypothetical protein HPP92_009488 [Vanilla planifolia]|uniref:Uncharacterized protein n=1 Tax=Vanilla planifolia TaxID=51239 RepID=A0A835RBM3_VANPL|nr:hypothetical protein HPP92_009488 [Vanilla planifolia]
MGRRSSVSQTHMGIFAFDPNLALSHVNEAFLKRSLCVVATNGEFRSSALLKCIVFLRPPPAGDPFALPRLLARAPEREGTVASKTERKHGRRERVKWEYRRG